MKDAMPGAPAEILTGSADGAGFVYSASTQEVEAAGPTAPPAGYPLAQSYEPVQWAWDDITFEVAQAVAEWSARIDADS